MHKQINIKTWIENFNNGAYNKPDSHFEAGWYDWFCRESSLQKKTQLLGKKLIQISKSKKFDIEKTYVFFKNNCPFVGPLRDDFRICDIRTGDVIYTVIPMDPRIKKAQVFGKENDFNGPLIEGSWRDIKDFFLKQV